MCVLCCEAAADLEELKAGRFSVTYPSGLQPQAVTALRVAQRTLGTKLAGYTELQQALEDRGKTARRIANLLGRPDLASDLQDRLSVAPSMQTVLLAMVTHLRLLRLSDFPSGGTIEEGRMRITVDREKDTLSVEVSGAGHGDPAPGSVFLPLVYDANGRLIGTDKGEDLAGTLSAYAQSSELWLLPLMLIHEAAESALVSELELHHPFARWFNEGVAQWVVLQLARERAPNSYGAYSKAFLPRSGQQDRRKANLLSWPQADYAELAGAGSPDRDALSTAVSTELVCRLFQRQPTGTLAQVLRRIAENRRRGIVPDSRGVCRAIQQVTRQDAWRMLLEYVPAQVSDGLQHGRRDQLVRSLMQAPVAANMQPSAAAVTVRRLLEMEPGSVAARLTRASVLYRLGLSADAAENEIKLAALLAKWLSAAPKPLLYGREDDDSRYVLGRFHQLLGRPDLARRYLAGIPESSRRYPDARAALRAVGAGQSGAAASDSRVLVGAGLLSKHALVDEPRLGVVTDVRVAATAEHQDRAIVVAGTDGALYLDRKAAVTSFIRFAVSCGRASIVQAGGNYLFADRCDLLQTSAFLLGADGKLMWGSGSPGGVDDMAAGDVDGDGRPDFVLGLNGYGGLRLLDENGKQQWQQPDANVWHVEVLAPGSGDARIVHSNATGRMIVRDGGGTVINTRTLPIYLTGFCLCRWGAVGAEERVLAAEDAGVWLCSVQGGLDRKLSAPGVGQFGVPSAVPVRLQAGGPECLAVAVGSPDGTGGSGLYLYDKDGQLIYHETLSEPCLAVARFPLGQTGPDALLVGGQGCVWQYELAGARPPRAN